MLGQKAPRYKNSMEIHQGKQKKKDKKKIKKGYIPTSLPETFATYEPCVHLHFKAEQVDRDCLSHEQYLDLLATPKGYHWNNEMEFDKAELNINKRKLKGPKQSKKVKPIKVKPDAGDFAEEFVEDMWDVMSPDITNRLIDFLVNEFGMSIEEAEDFIDFKIAAGKQVVCKKKKSKALINLGTKHKWVKDFSDVFSKRIEQYIASMLLIKRTPRVKKISERILNYFCHLTGIKTSLGNPKTKTQRAMVLIADRLALWIEDMMKDIDKAPIEREEEQEMEDEDNEREEDEEEEEEGEGKGDVEMIEEGSKGKKNEKIQKITREPKRKEENDNSKEKESTGKTPLEKTEETTNDKTDSEKNEQGPNAVKEKESKNEEATNKEVPKKNEESPNAVKEKVASEPENKNESAKPEQTEGNLEPTTTSDNPEESQPENNSEQKMEKTPPKEQENKSTLEAENLGKDTKPTDVAEAENLVKDTKPTDVAEAENLGKDTKPTDVAEKQDTPEEMDPQDQETENPKQETQDQQIDAKPSTEQKPSEIDKTPVQMETEAEKTIAKVDSEAEIITDIDKDRETGIAKGESTEENLKEDILYKQKSKDIFIKMKEKPPIEDIYNIVKEDILGVRKDRITDRQKAVKGVVDKRLENIIVGGDYIDGFHKEDIDDTASRIAHWIDDVILATEKDKDIIQRKSPGPAFKIKPKTGSTLEVQKLSSNTVVNEATLAKGLQAPPLERKIPGLKSSATQEWERWETNIANFTNEWGKWIDSTLSNAEKHMTEKIKGSPETNWMLWQNQKSTEAKKWRVEKERLRVEGTTLYKKDNEKLKHQSEVELKSTKLE